MKTPRWSIAAFMAAAFLSPLAGTAEAAPPLYLVQLFPNAIPLADHPNDENPTGTPQGQDPVAQAIDTPCATWEIDPSSNMTADQAQAIALQHLISEAPDAPRWIVTWNGGETLLDLDRESAVLQVKTADYLPGETTLPASTEQTGQRVLNVSRELGTPTDVDVEEVHTGITLADVEAVAAGRKSW
ncbi:MAG TPA: hypothetical protein VEI97_00225 [bacterium]|nr:hypothetical protein [bacterium]